MSVMKSGGGLRRLRHLDAAVRSMVGRFGVWNYYDVSFLGAFMCVYFFSVACARSLSLFFLLCVCVCLFLSVCVCVCVC